MSFRPTRELLKSLMTSAVSTSGAAVAGALAGATIRLVTNSPFPALNDQTVWADFTEVSTSNLNNYASQTATWSAVFADGSGNVGVTSNLLSYQPTSTSGLPALATGYALLTGAGYSGGAGLLLGAEKFPDQLNWTALLDSHKFVVEVEVPNGNNYGAAVEVL